MVWNHHGALVYLIPTLAFGQLSVTGTVQRADNSAIQGLTVVIENGGTAAAQFVTDASGNFALSVPAGTYSQIRVRNMGAAISGLPKQIEHTVVASVTISKDTVIDIKMPAYAKIHGTVFKTPGEPLKNAEVRAKRWVFGAEQPPWDWIISGADNGTYALYQDTGTVRIWVTPPAGTGGSGATFDLSIKKDTLIDLMMPLTRYLSGYVFSSRGDTLKGLGVTVELGGGQQVDSLTNGITGLYRIPLNPGTYNVRLRNQGNAVPGIPRTVEATVASALNFSNDSSMNFTMPAYPAVICSLTSQSGAPVAGTVVRSKRWVYGAEQPPWDWDSTTTAGVCTLYVGADSNKFWIDPPSGSPLIPFTKTAKIAKDTVLTLIMNTGATLSGTVRRFDGSPVEGITVAIEKETDYRYVQTDAIGQYSIRLQPATYRLRVRAMNAQLQGIPSTLEHTVMDTMVLAADRQIAITLPIFPVVSGTVRDPTGNPVSGVSLTAKRWVNGAEQPPWAGAVTGSNGAFTLVVGKGINRIWVSPPAGMLAPFDFIEAFDSSKTRDIYVAEQARGIKRVQPSVISTGQSGTITVVGINCSFSDASTLSLGEGITVSDIKAVSGITMTARISVAANAKPGNRDVLATSSGTTVVGSSLMTITAPASDTLILDNQGRTKDSVIISDGIGTTLIIPKGTAVTLPAGSDSIVSFIAPIIRDTASRPSVGTFVEVQRELGPSGLTFGDTVTLTAAYKPQDVEGINEATLKPFYFTDKSTSSGAAVVGDTMRIMKRDTAANTVAFGMTHFSMFRLSGRPRSATAASGRTAPPRAGLFTAQSFPSGCTALRFYVDEAHRTVPARLSIFDVAGRAVATAFDGIAGRGMHTVLWDAGRGAAGGVWICRLSIGERSEETRFVTVR